MNFPLVLATERNSQERILLNLNHVMAMRPIPGRADHTEVMFAAVDGMKNTRQIAITDKPADLYRQAAEMQEQIGARIAAALASSLREQAWGFICDYTSPMLNDRANQPSNGQLIADAISAFTEIWDAKHE